MWRRNKKGIWYTLYQDERYLREVGLMEYLIVAGATTVIGLIFFYIGYRAGKGGNILPRKTKVEETNFYG